MAYSDRVARLALWSIGVALGVMALKFLAWWLSGSVAIFSDALESIVNVVSAAIAWSAIRISRMPADEDHPFGHHKAEYFSAVIEGAMIVVAALLIFHQAGTALLRGSAVADPALGMAVNALATAVNAIWAWLLISTARRERSPALAADGRHILVDVVTSAGVLVGLGLAVATGWMVLDPLLALLVGANVLWEGGKVIKSSVGGLMDKAVEPVEADRLRATILRNAAGAIEVHDIRTRRAGPVSFVEFHLVVDGAMTVTESHAICDRLEKALAAELPGAHVTIHVEPSHKAKGDGLNLQSD